MAFLTRRRIRRDLRNLAFIALAVFVTPVLATDTVPLEDAIKATFVYKFVPFVTWPSSQLADFNVCTEGDDRVAELLAQTASSQNIDGRVVSVRTLVAGQPTDDCRILYIATTVPADAVLDSTHGKAVLTITQAGGPNHGIIQFVTIDHHVRFDIDTKLAADDGLTISSKLLVLAHTVTQAGP
jgi:hypothetical protein